MSRAAFALCSVVVLAGCPEESESTPPIPTVTAAPVASAPAPVVSVAPATPPKLAIEPRVKTEVDARAPDAGNTVTIAPPSAKGVLMAPTGWTTDKAAMWSTAASADQKSRVAAAAMAAGDSATAKAGDGAQTLGLTECEWGTPESVVAGKDKLAATAADGVCKRNGVDMRAAYMATTGAVEVITVGTWEAAGTDNGVFTTFRSVGKAVGGGGGAGGISACCAALSRNMVSAPPEQKLGYAAAIAVCNSLASSPDARAALASVRAAGAAANMPAACK